MTIAEENAPPNAPPIDLERLESRARSAIAFVDDPEYPGISIIDLGLLETVTVHADGTVRVGLIPTFRGCPALGVIDAEVRAAVEALNDVVECQVDWLSTPVWHADRVSHEARAWLDKKFGVAIQIGDRDAMCPCCASKTVEKSTVGASPCRSVHSCTGCGETVEVMRG